MSSLDPEIRSEVGKIKASEKETKILDAAFDEGRFAFVSGISRDGCRFRNPARRNAWERGWLESERGRAEHDSVKARSEYEKAKPRQGRCYLPSKRWSAITDHLPKGLWLLHLRVRSLINHIKGL